jgi:hypothetical protein
VSEIATAPEIPTNARITFDLPVLYASRRRGPVKMIGLVAVQVLVALQTTNLPVFRAQLRVDFARRPEYVRESLLSVLRTGKMAPCAPLLRVSARIIASASWAIRTAQLGSKRIRPFVVRPAEDARQMRSV